MNIAQFKRFFRKTNSFIFTKIMKPIGNLGISFTYYLAYFLLYLIKFVIQILAQSTQNKQKKEKYQNLIDSLPFPHPDVYRQATDIIRDHDIIFEIHDIVTEDDYILKVWRLRKSIKITKPHPLILQHGLLDCSWSWFINNSKEKTFPLILVEQGYDVWLTNNRGNKYCMNHRKLLDPPHNPQYWDFSFDEFAEQDIKANVNYVKQFSNSGKVIYIGHSQGTTQMFGHLSLHPEFQENLQCFIALGPAMYIGNFQSQLVIFGIKIYFFEILQWLGLPSFFVFDDEQNMKIGSLCYILPFLYRKGLFFITVQLCGYPRVNKIDLNRFGAMVSHEPGGTSVKTLVHWFQFYRQKDFKFYDYGKKEDAPKYPVENLKKISIPKYFYIGEKDVIADKIDVKRMLELFDKNTLETELIDDYAHLDYLWVIKFNQQNSQSVDGYKKFYPKVLEKISMNSK